MPCPICIASVLSKTIPVALAGIAYKAKNKTSKSKTSKNNASNKSNSKSSTIKSNYNFMMMHKYFFSTLINYIYENNK